jgi:hypothetical protein
MVGGGGENERARGRWEVIWGIGRAIDTGMDIWSTLQRPAVTSRNKQVLLSIVVGQLVVVYASGFLISE